METRFRSKMRVRDIWGGRGEWGSEGEGRGGTGYPSQGDGNDGVLAVKAKAEKF